MNTYISIYKSSRCDRICRCLLYCISKCYLTLHNGSGVLDPESRTLGPGSRKAPRAKAVATRSMIMDHCLPARLSTCVCPCASVQVLLREFSCKVLRRVFERFPKHDDGKRILMSSMSHVNGSAPRVIPTPPVKKRYRVMREDAKPSVQ